MSARRAAGWLAAALLGAAGGACARQERFPPPPIDPSIPVDSGARAEAARPVPLRVENRHRADLVIYATRGSVRTRLGTVTAETSADFAIPASFVNDPGGLYLIADPVGGRASSRSPQFIVRTGQRVVWTVQSNAAQSSLAVY